MWRLAAVVWNIFEANRSLVWSHPCFRGDRWCNLRLKRQGQGKLKR